MDESHIIRLIGYCDMERRQMPSWTHKAVLVTEHITKFLNVLQAIQYSVPITVIQIVATQKDDKGTHIFFTIRLSIILKVLHIGYFPNTYTQN